MMYYYCKKYAEEHGTVYTKPSKYTNDNGDIVDYEAFDYYVPDNPNEFRVIITDTSNLIDTERGMTLKQSMDKWYEYRATYLRNRYGYTFVEIQQQAFEGSNNESVKLGRTEPSIENLGDSKYSARNADIVLGLYSPFKFLLRDYEGYNITRFRDNIRFLKVCINRNGAMGGVCPLFFDGAVCDFRELPLPNDEQGIASVYRHLDKIRGNNSSIMMLYRYFNKEHHNKKLFKKITNYIKNLFNKNKK